MTFIKLFAFIALFPICNLYAQSDSSSVIVEYTRKDTSTETAAQTRHLILSDSLASKKIEKRASGEFLRRVFIDNFKREDIVDNGHKIFIYLFSPTIIRSTNDFNHYFNTGYGLGIGAKMYDSKRFTFAFSVGYAQIAINKSYIKSNLEAINPDLSSKIKPLSIVLVTPEIRFRPLIGKYLRPYVGMGLNAIFTAEGALVEVGGKPDYITLLGSIYYKPSIGIELKTNRLGTFIFEANLSRPLFTVSNSEDPHGITFLNFLIGYEF